MPERKFEDTIREHLAGDMRQNALDFVAFLRANDIVPDGAGGCEVFRYRDYPVCVVFVNGEEQEPGPWRIWHSGYDPKYDPDAIPDGEDADLIGLTDLSADEALKAAAWAHVNTCGSCGCGRQPGRRTAIFGRTFDNVCTSTLAFGNPDAQTLAHAKELAILMKEGIARRG